MSETNFVTTIEDADCDAAYEQAIPDALALPGDHLTAINIDIPTAIITVIGALPRLKACHMHAQQLPLFEFAAFEKLPGYALALASAQARYVSATTPPEQLPTLLAAATEKRDVFLADAQALVARGLLNAESLKEYKGMHGYRNVAFDLMGVVQLLKTAWPSIKGRTGLENEELVEANKLALRLVSALAHREQSPEQVAAASDMRQRIFTLFTQAYEQVRRAVMFLRWDHDDADSIAPSLYAGRPNSNISRKSNAEQKPTATPIPVAVAGESSPAAALPNAPKVPVGMPGSDPFMHS